MIGLGTPNIYHCQRLLQGNPSYFLCYEPKVNGNRQAEHITGSRLPQGGLPRSGRSGTKTAKTRINRQAVPLREGTAYLFIPSAGGSLSVH
jgi:hypothetical protein